jgi:hypothetical protein
VPVLVDEPDLRVELTETGIFHVRLRTTDREGDAILDAIQPHLEAHAPARYLVDVSNVRDLSLSERWRLAERMKENRQFIHRTAVLGVNSFLRFPVQVILRVSGRDNVRLFSERPSAERWLLED